MGVMKAAGAIFLIILSLIVQVSIPPLLFAHSAKAVVFDPAFYEEQFEEHGLYERFRDLIADSFFEMSDVEGEFAVPEDLKADLKGEIKNAMPVSWVKAQFNGLLENMLLFLKCERDELELKISLKTIKPNIITAAENIMEGYMETVMEERIRGEMGEIPPELEELGKNRTGPGGCASLAECMVYCSRPENMDECDQFAEEVGLPSGEEPGFPGMPSEFGENFTGPGDCTSKDECTAYCSVPANKEECELFFGDGEAGKGKNNTDFEDSPFGALAGIGSGIPADFGAELEKQIPDEFDFGEGMEEGGVYQKMLEAKNTLGTVFLIMDIAWIVPITALFLMVLITRNGKDACRWIGGALLTAGVATLLVAFLAPVAVGKMVEGAMPQEHGAAEFAAILKCVILELATAIFSGPMVPGGIIAVAGLCLLISSRFLGEKVKKRGKRAE